MKRALDHSFGDGGWKTAGTFLGHENPRLGSDASRREPQNQDPEKREKGKSVKVSSERPGHSGTRSDLLCYPRSYIELQTEESLLNEMRRSHRDTRASYHSLVL